MVNIPFLGANALTSASQTSDRTLRQYQSPFKSIWENLARLFRNRRADGYVVLSGSSSPRPSSSDDEDNLAPTTMRAPAATTTREPTWEDMMWEFEYNEPMRNNEIDLEGQVEIEEDRSFFWMVVFCIVMGVLGVGAVTYIALPKILHG
ncbi:hypothetical protein P280DRAFT_516843 [Massarina eburnea CBS 473.64]|uniref:Uncharacterized protein n=1 Tax=Massarina eburnea CBS 473.64 TaxID=1395130 RepID=A0A6A6S5X3_9PLEO|nr:hypothetical protein P280DRAFT_516843 [Massarina eburnea CBS 473.64]